MDLWGSRKTQGQAGEPHTQEIHHLEVGRARSAAQPAVFLQTALVFSPDLWRVPECASLLAVQKQRLAIQVVLQGERGAVPQAQVGILDQLRAEQASEAEHLVDLRPGLDGARSLDPHVVDGLTGAEAESVDQVTGDQNA